MKPQLEVTYDIMELIIGIIANDSEDPDDTTTSPHLRNLSLTCKSMVPLCRKYLFSTLILGEDPEQSHRFRSLISDNPEIPRFIRKLDYTINDPSNLNADDHHILEALKSQSAGLQTICLQCSSSRGWSIFPTALQTLLEQLINLSSVTDLQLSRLKAIPPSILASFNSLRSLTLEDVDVRRVNPPENAHDTNRLALGVAPLLRGRLTSLSVNEGSYDVMRFAMQPQSPSDDRKLVDFSGLRDLECFFGETKTKDRDVIWQVLRIATSLTSLALEAWGPAPLAGLGAALLIYNVSSLRRLTISTNVTHIDEDPVCGVIPELSVIAGMNALEELHLKIEFDTGWIAQPETENNWSALDSLLTTSGSFPMLKLVVVDIIAYGCHSGASEAVVRNGIREDRFPRLLKSDTVVFRFSSKEDCSCGDW